MFPSHAYRDSWDRLVRGDAWGDRLNLIGRPVIGILGDGKSDLPKIVQVRPASPAQAAGLSLETWCCGLGMTRSRSSVTSKRWWAAAIQEMKW